MEIAIGERIWYHFLNRSTALNLINIGAHWSIVALFVLLKETMEGDVWGCD